MQEKRKDLQFMPCDEATGGLNLLFLFLLFSIIGHFMNIFTVSRNKIFGHMEGLIIRKLPGRMFTKKG